MKLITPSILSTSASASRNLIFSGIESRFFRSSYLKWNVCTYRMPARTSPMYSGPTLRMMSHRPNVSFLASLKFGIQHFPTTKTSPDSMKCTPLGSSRRPTSFE